MAKKILKTSWENGAFVAKGDQIEVEVPYSTKTIIVEAVEINLNSGEAKIHGLDEKSNQWTIPASSLISVINKKLTLSEGQ